jgi:hypothetical protein
MVEMYVRHHSTRALAPLDLWSRPGLPIIVPNDPLVMDLCSGAPPLFLISPPHVAPKGEKPLCQSAPSKSDYVQANNAPRRLNSYLMGSPRVRVLLGRVGSTLGPRRCSPRCPRRCGVHMGEGDIERKYWPTPRKQNNNGSAPTSHGTWLYIGPAR